MTRRLAHWLALLALALPLATPARAQDAHGDARAAAAAPTSTPPSAAASTPAAAAPASVPAATPAPSAAGNNASAAGNAAPDVAAPNPNAAAAPPAMAAGPAPRANPNAGAVMMPSTSPTGSLLQTLLALIVVLGVLGALAWFLKRYGPRAGGGNANLRIVGSLNLGGRERLLVVEIGDQWIVVGAAPGRVNGLATLPKQEGVEPGAALLAPGPSAASFGDWLKQTLDKRK